MTDDPKDFPPPALPEGVEASPLEIAFGCLWRAVTDDASLHGARQYLANLVGPEGRRRGVQWAVANLAPVTDAEIRSIEI